MAGFLVRVRTWLRRSDLDRALSEGADPSATAELSLRADQLTAPAELHRLAASIEAAIEAIVRPPAGLSQTAALRQSAVVGARPALLGLAQRLRDPEPVPPQAAAMASFLLSSAEGPLYGPAGEESLWAFARRASWIIDDARGPARAAGEG